MRSESGHKVKTRRNRIFHGADALLVASARLAFGFTCFVFAGYAVAVYAVYAISSPDTSSPLTDSLLCTKVEYPVLPW